MLRRAIGSHNERLACAVKTGTSLNDLLKALGMTSAFIPDIADFSGMDGTQNLYIWDVMHKAFINVAEKATEAAAAVVMNGDPSAPPAPQLVLASDRPFLYFLRDKPTGANLFMGRVLDPSQN